MSTRASIVIQDESTKLYFYRHSDGYPEGGAGDDLKEFVAMYTTGQLRMNAGQSAGWLVVRGHFEYKGASVGPVNDDGTKLWADEPDRTGPVPSLSDRYSGWKVGAYEPTDGLHGDVEYIYVIDLAKKTLTCRVPKAGFWDESTLKNTVVCKKFETVRF